MIHALLEVLAVDQIAHDVIHHFSARSKAAGNFPAASGSAELA